MSRKIKSEYKLMNQIEKSESEKYESLIAATASRVQEDFRKIYLDPESGARRVKTTKDKFWIKQHGTDRVDMAMMDYLELPSDWQSERKIGAQIAINAVLEAAKNGQALDEGFIERTSELLHDKWLERNHARATEIEKGSYASLPDNEKEKDRFFARAAIEIYQSTS